MVQIARCSYCGHEMANPTHVEKCRIIEMEDILAAIKSSVPVGGTAIKGFPQTLSMRIIRGRWKTRAALVKEIEEGRKLADQKARWEMMRSRIVREAVEAWEKKNPDPNPPRF